MYLERKVNQRILYDIQRRIVHNIYKLGTQSCILHNYLIVFFSKDKFQMKYVNSSKLY